MVMIDLSDTRARRPKTLSPRRLRREKRFEEKERDVDLLRIIDDARPRLRSECQAGPRPCLFVSCRFHLYLDVNERTGSIKINFPDVDISDLPESCALDIAERGGLTLEEIGRLLNVTRERARQVEESGLSKLKPTVG